LWYLGYPEQALHMTQEALALAQELAHPFSRAFALHYAARLHQCRQEGRATQLQAEAALTLFTEQGVALYAAFSRILQGWAWAAQGHGAEGMAQMRQGLAAYQATGAKLTQTYWLALLAEAYGQIGQVEAGLDAVAEALAAVDTGGERFYAAELYRLKGELMLQSCPLVPTHPNRKPRPDLRKPPHGHLTDLEAEAEICFQQALAVARRQQAKSQELRATISLAR
jgi:predicted ATPase